MGYVVDRSNTFLITEAGQPVPTDCRVIPHDVGSQLDLHHGQVLSADAAELLVDGRLETYLSTLSTEEQARLRSTTGERRPVSLHTGGMMLVTTPTVPGWHIDAVHGAVVGNTVRTRNALSRLGAGLSANFGGELTAYTDLLTSSRNEAVSRMVAEARTMGANAVVGVFFSTSSLLEIATEVLVFGTAVTIAPG